jgi:hypothetical protein
MFVVLTVIGGVMVFGARKFQVLQVGDKLLDGTLIQTSALREYVHVIEHLE